MMTYEERLSTFIKPIYNTLSSALVMCTPLVFQVEVFDINNFPHFELLQLSRMTTVVKAIK